MIRTLADAHSLEAKSTTSSGETSIKPTRPSREEKILPPKLELSLAGTFGCIVTQVHRKTVFKQLQTRPARVLQRRSSLHEGTGTRGGGEAMAVVKFEVGSASACCTPVIRIAGPGSKSDFNIASAFKMITQCCTMLAPDMSLYPLDARLGLSGHQVLSDFGRHEKLLLFYLLTMELRCWTRLFSA